MIARLLSRLIASAIFVVAAIIIVQADSDLDDLYCSMNQFAKERIRSNKPVFPCNQS